MRNYRDNWFNVGAVLAIAIAGALALSHQRKLSRSRLFSALNFAASLVHQFEEYGFPGYFPGHLNSGLFKSDKPDRYPLNANSALIINTALAYPFYVLPVLFGFSQAVGHGFIFPASRRSATAPGSWPPPSCTCPSASTTSARSPPSVGWNAGSGSVRRPTRSPSPCSGSQRLCGC